MSRKQLLFLAVFVPVVIALSLTVARSIRDDGPDVPELVSLADDQTDFEYDFVIEPGTAARIAAGEDVEVVPQELEVKVGESIRIVNNDSANHSVGIFFVLAGQTLTQNFRSPGVLEGSCSVHPSGRFTLRVTE